MNENNKKTVYNCHTHIFTIDHVPNELARSLVWRPFSKILTIKLIKWYYTNLTVRGSERTKKKRYKKFVHKSRKIKFKLIKILKFTYILWWIYLLISNIIKWIVKILLNLFKIEKILSPELRELINRYLILARYSAQYTQAFLFTLLKKNYPSDTNFIALSMDMEYMKAAQPKKSYLEQLEGLIKIKNRHKNFYPFIAVDPRRIAATKNSKGKDNFQTYTKSLLQKKLFNGIKIYPALGYYPFDKELIDTYHFAQENDIPIITHCNIGSVFYRGKKEKDWKQHPILKYNKKGGTEENIPLPQTKNYDFTTNFTHPMNYHCLLDKEIISKYLGRETDLSKLKICFGHFGGSEEWEKYRNDVWNNYNNKIAPVNKEEYEASEIKNTLNHKSTRTIWWNASWLSVIYDLMVRYDNVYADISFILYYEKLFPILKYLLHDEKVKHKILFGTDYYVVSQKENDKTLYQNIRGYLGEKLFMMIAHDNAKRFLATKLPAVKKRVVKKQNQQ